MAEFKFRCPYCLQKLKAEEEWRGEPMECPKCHRQYNIPEKIAPSGASADDGGGASGPPKFSSDDLRRKIADAGKILFDSAAAIFAWAIRHLRKIADVGKILFDLIAAIFSGLFRGLRKIGDAGKTSLSSNATASMGFVRRNREEIDATGKFLIRGALAIFVLALAVSVVYLMISMISRNTSGGSNNGAPAANIPAPVAAAPAPPPAPSPAPAPVAYRPPPVEYSEPRKILVHVTVKKKFTTPYEYYKYNCEYKLYADDVCVATKNSKSTIVNFNVRVPKGAALRAEMLGKNGFGGVVDSICGPNFGEKAPVASFEGDYIEIGCW